MFIHLENVRDLPVMYSRIIFVNFFIVKLRLFMQWYSRGFFFNRLNTCLFCSIHHSQSLKFLEPWSAFLLVNLISGVFIYYNLQLKKDTWFSVEKSGQRRRTQKLHSENCLSSVVWKVSCYVGSLNMVWRTLWLPLV